MKKSCVERQGALYSCGWWASVGELIRSGEALDIMTGKATWWGKTKRGMYGRANGKTARK
jgi:hypothetical protein